MKYSLPNIKEDTLALRIFNNLPSLSAQRLLGVNHSRINKTVARVASGQRILKSADDAAGLAISEGLHSDTRVLKQGVRNLNDGIALINVMDGALAEQSSILIRLREIASQAATGTIGTIERGTIDLEFKQLRNEFDRIGNVTEFNGLRLLDGTLSNSNSNPILIHVGLNSEEDSRFNLNRELDIPPLNSQALNFKTDSLNTPGNALLAMDKLEPNLKKLSEVRSSIGGTQQRILKALNNLNVSIENLSAAENQVRGADFVEELVSLTRNRILVESATAMVGQANLTPQGVLQLVQS